MNRIKRHIYSGKVGVYLIYNIINGKEVYIKQHRGWYIKRFDTALISPQMKIQIA